MPPLALDLERAARTEIVLLTVAPGELIWEHYGHNELVLFEPRRGTGASFNYGVFDLTRPDFYEDFFFGSWEYRLAVFSVDEQLEHYRRAGRTVWLQHLDLTVRQRAHLIHYLEENATEERAWYRYHYYEDNCSTRIRDAIDEVTGGSLRKASGSKPAQPASGADPDSVVSYRYHTLRLSGQLTPSGLLAYLGTMLVFGTPIEQPITVWDEMFIPMRVRDVVRTVTVVNDQGVDVPLVDREETIPPNSRPRDPIAPPAWALPFVGIGGFVALALSLLARLAQRRVFPRVLFALAATAVSLANGVCGVFIASVWAMTGHDSAHGNVNVLYFTPLALVLAFVTPFAACGRPRALGWARAVSMILLGLAVFGVILELIPACSQTNAPLLGLVLPVHVALALAWKRWPRPVGGVAPAAV